MPVPAIVLMLLIGIVFGGMAAVLLRADRTLFIVNVLLGVMGASLGAFLPVLIGREAMVDVSSMGYLIRALAGAFALVLLASLFRSARPRGVR